MESLRTRALVLSAWTLFVWATRIRNIVGDDSLDGGAKAGRAALALSFTVLALVVGVVALRRLPRLWEAVVVLAGWTLAVWVARSVGIATDHHGAGFVAVHLVLALGSIALCAHTLLAGWRARTGSPVPVGSR
jgi:hypothetical protein